jgi:hypothetical protein
MVWACYGAPGSILLTLFLKEWLRADKWQIGLVMTMTFLGPVIEPAGAYLVERFGRRRLLFLITYLLNRLAFFAIAAIPFFGSPDQCRDLGIGVVLAVVGCTRVVAHLGTPAWWSWMADLVPERRRSRFFGCRTQAASAVTSISFVAGMILLQCCGGMGNRSLVSALFAIGAVFGTVDILLYLRVPEPPMPATAGRHGIRGFVQPFSQPFRQAAFCRLILGMGLWSFSTNLVLPFLPVYQRGETLAGHSVGLGVSWLFLACLTVAGSFAAMVTSRRWADWSERLGTTKLLLLGSGYLFVNLIYLVVGPNRLLWVLLLVSFLGGALNAAWIVSTQQLLLHVSPRENRSFYISAHNFTNGLLMAGGPLLGGLLADWLPVLGWHMPGGLAWCYFHILLLLALCGGTVALGVLAGVPAMQQVKDYVLAARPMRLRKARVSLHGKKARRIEPALEDAEQFANV